MIPDVLRQRLDSAGIRYRVIAHEPRVTAQETARAAHVPGRQFAKAVLLRARSDSQTQYVIAALPASEEVDMQRLGAALGQAVELATEQEYAERFPEYDVGAAPPLGDGQAMPVVADACLQGGLVVMNGGTHTDLVEMPWPDFVRLAHPEVVDFGKAPAVNR